MFKEITQKIIDLLKADSQLGVSDIYFGDPMRWEKFPHIWVDWERDPTAPRTTNEQLHQIAFIICLHVRGKNADAAEKDIDDKTDRIRAICNANRTLGNLVRDSWVMDHVKRTGKIADYALSEVRVFLHCELGETI